MKYWSKTALSIYRYLEMMSNSLDKTVTNLGKNSNSQSLQKYHTTYSQAGKIIELIDRKRKIINLKVCIEEALNNLPEDDMRILTLFYLDGVKSELLAQLFGVSLRTFFRKKLHAIENFLDELVKLGYNNEFFEQEYGKERWILPVYNDCISKDKNIDDSLNLYLVKKIFNEISKINMAYNTYV